MINFIKTRIGLKLLLAFSVVLGISLILVILISVLLFKDFGQFTITENEQRIKSQAVDFLAAITQERAQKYEAIFQKIAAHSRFIAKQAELKYQLPPSTQKKTAQIRDALHLHVENNIFYADHSAQISTIYWGGVSVPETVNTEIMSLAPFASVLVEAKEQNPALVASHIIMTSGWAHYYPNNNSVYLLPPVSVLDLRDTNNYVLAHPDNNPDKKTIWVPVYYDDVGNGLMTTASSPIFGRHGEFLGVAGVDLPLNNIQQQILVSSKIDEELKSEGFVSFLLDSRSKLISFPAGLLEKFGIENPSDEFDNSLDLLEKGLMDSSLQDVRNLGNKILSGPNQTYRFLLNKEPHIISSQLLESTGWYLVTTIPEKNFLFPLREVKATLLNKIDGLKYQFYLLAFFFLIGSVAVITLFLQRAFIRPLRQVTQAVTQVEAGNLNPHLETERTDEIGVLLSSFGGMVKSLRRGKDLEHNYTVELQQKVTEQTYRLEAQKGELELDIQRRQLIEKELHQAKILADTANKAKSQFLSSMTHELRTPLLGVLGMNELLTRTPLSEQQQLLVDTVQNSGQDLLLIINNILDFSKIESGNLPLKNVEFDLHKVVEDVFQLLTESAQKKCLNLAGRIGFEALWRVKADPVKLRQIIVNLINNAIKFTLQGDVLVEVSLEKVSDNRGYFKFIIQDTGIGINQEDLDQIFLAFTQVDNSQERKYAGSGLGLAIVRQLVDLMEGEISVVSQPDQGSCFKVILPLELVEQQKPDLPGYLNNSRVLLQVEHSFIRETLQQMLSVSGCQVYPVATGEEAWNRLITVDDKSNSFDMAFIEAKASVSDGSLLSEKICRDTTLSRLSIIGICYRSSLLASDFPSRIITLERPVSWGQFVTALNKCNIP